ncbi:MAG: YdeI/OmpD-associated family protein [Pseudomonadota bacterium]
MKVTETFRAQDRAQWRSWLETNHASSSEIWLISDDRPDDMTIEYLDSVEEALCFGWVDGIAKRISDFEKAQRFTPRRPRSNWTELNKERARRLISLGLMTDAGRRILPDLNTPFMVASDIRKAIEAEPSASAFFATLPDLYVRVRIGYIEEMRKQPGEFARRLNNFLKKTAAGKMYGNWNDDGRLLAP